ncbi:MAG: hypothetical protein IPL43_07330 [Micropruina sp.]|nr:hypothetical protein [Micropruina sp.]
MGQAIHNNQLERQRLQEEKLLAARALRQAVARDLHDTLARSTTNMVLRAEQAKLRGVGDAGLGGDLDFIISAGGAVIRDLRSLMETLRRTDVDADLDALSELEGVSLAEVFRQQLEQLTEAGFQPRLLQDVSLDDMSPAVASELARSVIEAAANIAKHAAPGTACEFLIARDDDDVELVVVNRPGGRRVAQSNHFGLLGARERIGFLGGELTVSETPDSFVLQVRLPIGAQR